MLRTVHGLGFSAKELSIEDSEAIFDVLAATMLDYRKHISMIEKDKRVIRGRIAFTFKKDKYIAIGVFKSKKLVGVALCNDNGDVPWIGHMTVLKEYRKTKAFIMLAYYIANVLYKNQVIRLNTPNIKDFKSVIKVLPKVIGGQAITIETAERLKKIVERS